jgi:hypothetical protein
MVIRRGLRPAAECPPAEGHRPRSVRAGAPSVKDALAGLAAQTLTVDVPAGRYAACTKAGWRSWGEDDGVQLVGRSRKTSNGSSPLSKADIGSRPMAGSLE